MKKIKQLTEDQLAKIEIEVKNKRVKLIKELLEIHPRTKIIVKFGGIDVLLIRKEEDVSFHPKRLDVYEHTSILEKEFFIVKEDTTNFTAESFIVSVFS